MKKQLPSKDYINDCIQYDAESGDVFWKERPESHFKNKEVCRCWNNRFSGCKAGSETISTKTYRTISLANESYSIHRVIWMLVYGKQPIEIDHIDGNGTNNRLDNLRDVIRVENCRNQRLRTSNTSGHIGVGWRKDRKKWRAYIMVDGETVHLGHFTNKKDAIKRRRRAEIEYGFHPNHGDNRPLWGRER